MIKYVLGFVFDATGKKVWLIEKNRPEWQAGKLNGIGGKVEPGETPVEAMAREAAEEAGMAYDPPIWTHVHTMYDREAVVDVFATDVADLPTSLTDEPVNVYPYIWVNEQNLKLVHPNLTWLVPLAKASLSYDDWSASASVGEMNFGNPS